jgi:ribose transport system permease protein
MRSEHPHQETAHKPLSAWMARLDWSLPILALYLAVIYAAQPAFFSHDNLWALMYYTALLAPAVLGVHILIVLGLFDLSVGAVAAVAGVVAAKVMLVSSSVATGLACGIVMGALFGFVNWIFVVKFRISALIGTLITLGIASAVSLGITEGKTIAGLPVELATLALGSPDSWLTPAILLALVLVSIFELLTRRHVIFRRFYHVGSNAAAAAGNGINVEAIKLCGFTLASAGAAVVGLLQCSRTLSASPFVFGNLALECIAACVIGGASLGGGTGTALGALFGMLIVVISRNLVVMAEFSVYWQELGIALILLAAVLLKRGELVQVRKPQNLG